MPLREYAEKLASSQDRAIELARAGAAPGSRVVAGSQTDGRGRRSRRWESPVGGLYLSVVVGAGPRRADLLSLAVGASLAGEIERRYGAPVRVKWPNDLVVLAVDGRPRKLGGILIDRVAGPAGEAVCVVGVGVNVRPPVSGWGSELEANVTSLDRESPMPVALDELEELVVAAIDSATRELDAPDGPGITVDRVRERLVGLGSDVAVDGRYAGRLVALSEDGALCVECAEGRREVRSGDVRIVEAAT